MLLMEELEAAVLECSKVAFTLLQAATCTDKAQLDIYEMCMLLSMQRIGRSSISWIRLGGRRFVSEHGVVFRRWEDIFD
jgi:hypothetical protein